MWIFIADNFPIYRMNEEHFKPVLELMLESDREKTEALLKSKGEERMRWEFFAQR